MKYKSYEVTNDMSKIGKEVFTTWMKSGGVTVDDRFLKAYHLVFSFGLSFVFGRMVTSVGYWAIRGYYRST